MNEVTKISNEIIASLIENDKRKRQHAKFWSFYKKTSKELGIFSEIFNEFQFDLGSTIIEWGACNPDPPDIFAKLSDNTLHGIEITELVNERAINTQINHPENYFEEQFQLDFEKSVKKLVEILHKKEKKVLASRNKYQSLSLLIHTDELLLTSELFIGKGQEIFPSGSSVFEKVYLLLSYEPDNKKCPLIRLI